METKNLTARPSTPTAAVLSSLPMSTAPWSPSLACGHVRQAHTAFVGLFAGLVTGGRAVSKGSTGAAGIGGNGRGYALARLIPAMSEAVSAKPAAADQRRELDVASGVPPREGPD